MYWLGTSRWCLGPLCMLHFCLNLFLSSLHTILAASMFVWFCCTFWWVFNFCGMKDTWAFGLMFPDFHSFPRLGIAWVKALTFLAHILFFSMSMGLLARDPTMPLHCSYYIITSLLFSVTCGLMGWCSYHVSPLSTSLPLLGFIGQHSCCASPFHSSDHLLHFTSFTFMGFLLNPLGFHGPITTSLPLITFSGLLALKPT